MKTCDLTKIIPDILAAIQESGLRAPDRYNKWELVISPKLFDTLVTYLCTTPNDLATVFGVPYKIKKLTKAFEIRDRYGRIFNHMA